MPWLEITIRHGPGHQSKRVEYYHFAAGKAPTVEFQHEI